MRWLAFVVVTRTIKWLTRLLCRIDDAQLARVPQEGPLIIVTNHVNFLEVPILYTHLLPRRITGWAKAETWHNPLKHALADLWEAIPIRRGEPDMKAIRKALDVLEAGGIVVIAPEGTRSGHGRLQRGRAGAVLLALRSGAPILPVVFYGGEEFWRNLARLRRTDFHIVVGTPFHVNAGGAPVTREMRQQMIDEVMYQMAALLPPRYRGLYADLGAATQRHLRFPSGATSNLSRA